MPSAFQIIREELPRFLNEPHAEDFREVVGAMVPQTPSDLAMEVAMGPVSKAARLGSLALSGLTYAPEAESAVMPRVAGGLMKFIQEHFPHATASVRQFGKALKTLPDPIQTAKKSELFKSPGLEVPRDPYSAEEIRKELETQGLDTGKTWIRGKKPVPFAQTPHYKYDVLEYLYGTQNRPEAYEQALRNAQRYQGHYGSTLSHQPGDRGVTKFNTTGGVWLTDSPVLAETYTGKTGYMIPVYAPKPEAVLDAKGEQWADFYRQNKDWLEAHKDPSIRSIEVRNVIDAGPNWADTVSEGLTDEQILQALTANNLFLKKPFNNRVVNKLTGEPFPFRQGGLASFTSNLE